MSERTLIVGVDPDCDKSGVAVLNPITKELELCNLTFFQLFDYLQFDKDKIKLVVVEAGWQNRGNWHAVKGSPSINAQIGQRTGANHQVGKLIVQMAAYLGLETELVKPTRSKVDAKQFARITGVIGRTNQEIRDAGILVWGRK